MFGPQPVSRASGDVLTEPTTHVQLVQTGGYTGLARSAALTLDELEPAEADRAGDALRDLGQREVSATPGAAPSQPRYELTVTDGSGSHTFVLLQSDIPDELRPLLQALIDRM